MFENLEWNDVSVTLNGVTFLLEGKAPAESGPTSLWLYKDAEFIAEYKRFLSGHPDLQVDNCVELGLWKGGSAVFWLELFQAKKVVGIDLDEQEDQPGLQAYMRSKEAKDRLRLYWRTSQEDRARLLEIIQAEFEGPLDVVIDDASHAYAATKASFEVLFPLLREGGLYLIEDWPWQFSSHFRADFPASEPGLVPLISDLAELLVAAPKLIQQIDIRRPFLALQRGPLPSDEASPIMHRLWHEGATIKAQETGALKARRLKRRFAGWVRRQLQSSSRR
jgi:methyltransferase family protein